LIEVCIRDTKNFNKETFTENLMRNLSEKVMKNNINHYMSKFMEIFQNI